LIYVDKTEVYRGLSPCDVWRSAGWRMYVWAGGVFLFLKDGQGASCSLCNCKPVTEWKRAAVRGGCPNFCCVRGQALLRIRRRCSGGLI